MPAPAPNPTEQPSMSWLMGLLYRRVYLPMAERRERERGLSERDFARVLLSEVACIQQGRAAMAGAADRKAA